MKKILIPICYVFSTVLVLSSCSNSTTTKSNEVEQHNHDGHDHSAHAHNQAESTPAAPNITQTAPAASIPAFTFYKVKSGLSFANSDIPAGKKTAFILFDPNCGHCQHEAAALASNYNKIKDVNIYFVSMNDPALQATFLETFAKELVGKPNIEVLYDRNQDFIQKFHVPKQFPANYIYGADGQLQTSWDGERPINEIIEAYTN